jgi:hypothetical protein
MEWKERLEKIKKADELVEFARKVFNNKRVGLLKKAAKLYKEATLSLMSDKLEKEADDWDIWLN